MRWILPILRIFAVAYIIQMEDQSVFDCDSLRAAYSGVVFSISNDLIFGQTFLPAAIQAHREKYPQQTRFFESGLYAYNINLSDNKGWLHGLGLSVEITKDSLEASRERFFMWIRLLSIVRIYNALELLLYGIIETRYLPSATLQQPMRKLKTLILTELKNDGVSTGTKNNAFLLTYLGHRSPFPYRLL
jgi:hypothetical protein